MRSRTTENPFQTDVTSNDGYRYTTNAGLSSRLANRRMTRAMLAATDFAGKRVLDVGCGDGTYSIELAAEGGSTTVHALDPVRSAVEVAGRKHGRTGITFGVASAYELPFTGGSFDIVALRGVLHHMDEPRRAIAEALRVAGVVAVIEPNGYNPVLKLLERFSRYHIEHGERSYAPRRLDRWASDLGGRVVRRQWVGLVPMFAPDQLARILKRIEPVLERVPLLRCVTLAQYVITVRR